MESNARAVLHNPTTLIVTDQGSTYFMRRGQRLQRYALINGQEEYGLHLRDYQSDSLRALIAHGLIRKVQFPVNDPASQRREIVTLLTGVSHALLMRMLANQAERALARSAVARDWNRAHPARTVGSAQLNLLARSSSPAQQDQRGRLAAVLSTRVRTMLRSEGSGRAPDAETTALVERLLQHLPETLWFLLVQSSSSPRGRELFDQTAELVARAVQQATIGDYLGLVWLELLTHLQTTQQPGANATMHLLIHLTGLEPDASAAGRPTTRMHIAASAGGGTMGLLQADLAATAAGSGPGTSFEQFWQQASVSSSHLGLYYLGFLEDACRRTGVSFRSFAQSGAEQGQLIMSLGFEGGS